METDLAQRRFMLVDPKTVLLPTRSRANGMTNGAQWPMRERSENLDRRINSSWTIQSASD